MSTKSAEAATSRALLDVRPGRARRRDPVAAPVPGDQVPTGQGAHRVRALQPGRQRDDADHARVVGDVYGGPGAHRVAEQDHGYAGMLGGRLVDGPSRVRDRRRLGADSGVPAAYAEPEQPQREPLVEHSASRERCAWPTYAGTRHSWVRPRPAPPSRRRAASARCRAVVRMGSLRSSPGEGMRHSDSCQLSVCPVFRSGPTIGWVSPICIVRGRGHRSPRAHGAFGLGLPGSGASTCRCGTARWTRERDGHPDRGRHRRRATRARRCHPRDRPPGRPAPGAPGAGRGDRGRALALLRARRPDPRRRRLRQEAAPARGARGRGPRPPHARLAHPEGRRRGLDRVHRGRPPRADGEPRQRLLLRGARDLGGPAATRRHRRPGVPLRAQGRRPRDQPALRGRPPGPRADPRRRPHRRGRHPQRQDDRLGAPPAEDEQEVPGARARSRCAARCSCPSRPSTG